MLELDWQNQTKADLPPSAIKLHLESILTHLRSDDQDGLLDSDSGLLPITVPDTLKIEIAIMDDKEITKLNSRFRHQDAPTDVLSFENSDQVNLLGSITISAQTAARQAKSANISLLDECRMLSGHGLLHLLGYSHH